MKIEESIQNSEHDESLKSRNPRLVNKFLQFFEKKKARGGGITATPRFTSIILSSKTACKGQTCETKLTSHNFLFYEY